MRETISFTVDRTTARRLKTYAQRERRSVSQVVEFAIERLLEDRLPAGESIVTTRGRFNETLSREETYGSR